DFRLVKGGSVNGTITTITGTGDSYMVTVSGISGAGTLRLDVKDAGTGIKDATGNALSGGFTTGESYTIVPLTASYGFVSVTPLSSIPFNSDTQFKPQGKTWYYDGKWWCAINPAAGGTHIYRLDGTTWTDVLSFSDGGRTDCWVVGNLVHILIYRGTLESKLVSIEYDPANGTYKRWSQRTSATPISFPAGTEVATITVDGTGRLWTTSTKESATAGFRDVLVWYSDGPNYTSWSAPITIATNISNDDISAITKLPGKIGVLWSNQTTGLFGFKTHSDASAPADWSSDEMPASQSAISGNPRMADDHISMVVASDGTLYAAIKTSYNSAALPIVGLLVRHPNGTWDDLHTVATGSEGGTQPIVVVNEQLGKVKVIYTTQTNGGDIVYKESKTSSISFGIVKTLISGGGPIYNFASSTHQVYNPDVVILATKINPGLPNEVVSVLASDKASAPAVQVLSTRQEIQPFSTKIYPTLANRGTNIIIQTTSNRTVEVWVVDAYGRTMYASTFAGAISIPTAKLSAGVHYVTIKDNDKYETQRIVIVN
ncbi:MAG: T9SS type A sorting domain-containing protein, partial [Flavisolibacter sp.]|nr:T9SS type A sorting domain-containing protein [Flavisolibacter sp.]